MNCIKIRAQTDSSFIKIELSSNFPRFVSKNIFKKYYLQVSRSVVSMNKMAIWDLMNQEDEKVFPK